MAVAALLAVPASDIDGTVYSNIDGEKSVIGVDTDEDYTIIYENTDYDDATAYPNMSMSIEYDAKLVDSSGNTVSSGVSPSSGSLTNGVPETLTVSAPEDAGNYKLVVSYTVEVTYTDSEGETVEVPEEDLVRDDDTYSIKVVKPITLSVTLTNGDNLDLDGFGLYFIVDGEKMEDSFTTIDLEKEGSTSVTYDWIADASSGAHTFKVVPADSGNLVSIDGLDKEHTFYVGDNDYSIYTTLLVVLIVIILLVMVWVYRKPVKNFGKPKSRR